LILVSIGLNGNVEWVGLLNRLCNSSFDVCVAALKMAFEVRRVFGQNFVAPFAGVLVLRVNYKLKNEYLHGNWVGFRFLEQNPVGIKL